MVTKRKGAANKVGSKAPKAEVETPEEVEETTEETEEETEEEVDEAAAESEESEEEDADDEEEEVNVGPAVDIFSRGKEYVRTYSKKVHGKDFEKLAKQFVAKESYAKREYAIVPSATILELIVEYREKEDAEKPLDQQNPDSPMVDKAKKFTDKEAALRFKNLKKGTCTVSIRK